MNLPIKRMATSLTIVFLVAAAHLMHIGGALDGSAFNAYVSYFSDLFIPLAAYYILCAAEVNLPFLRPWYLKMAVVFAAAALDETGQYFGFALLGRTFDPLDYLMYAAGAGLGALVDRQVLARLLPFWREKTAK